MAISEKQIQDLEQQVASGIEEVQDGRRRVRHRSVRETLEALDFARRQAEQAAGTTRIKGVMVTLK